MGKPTPYSIHFRERELTEIFNHIIDGDSISLVGIGTVGKTHLLKHFSERPEVQSHLLGLCGANAIPEDIVFVKVDPNALLDIGSQKDARSVDVPPAWPGFELIFHRLQQSINDFEKPIKAKVSAFYESINNIECLGPQMIFRLLENAVRQVFSVLDQDRGRGSGQGRVVIIFDEFHTLLNTMPISFFLNLRALRDEFRYQLLYITASRQEITSLVREDQRSQIEPFSELFQKTVYIGPYSTDHDIEEMFEALNERMLKGTGHELNSATKKRLRYIAGGHGGLTRTCCRFIEVVEHHDVDDEAIVALLHENGIIEECKIILESFDENEKRMLETIARSPSFLASTFSDRRILRQLENKLFAEKKSNFCKVIPPIFDSYLRGIGHSPLQETFELPY